MNGIVGIVFVALTCCQATELRNSRFKSHDPATMLMLPIDEVHVTRSGAGCAAKCMESRKTCYSYSYNKGESMCVLGSWIVPQNKSSPVTSPKILSTGKFCNTTENATLDYTGDLQTCDRAACLGRIGVGNNTTFNPNDPVSYKSCSDVHTTNIPRKLVKLTNGLIVMCDTVTDGGGWTIFQRRFSGEVDFNRSWVEYKEGFGDYGSGDFYLGNDNIHCLSYSKLYKMRIDFTYQGTSYAYVYPNFKLYGESDKYKLSFSGYSGPRPDVNAYFNNALFSTYDQDNDNVPSGSCAKGTGSGWWHQDCFFNNLNGKFGGTTGSGIYWYLLTNYDDSLDFTEMKMKPQ